MLIINSNQSGTLDNRHFKSIDKSARMALTKDATVPPGEYQADDHYYIVGVGKNGILFFDAGD